MKKVLVVVNTRKASIAGADSSDPYTYVVRKANDDGTGEPVDQTSTVDAQASFNLPADSYKVVVSRFNFDAVATFVVKDDEQDMVDVPETLTVTLGDKG